MQIKIYDEIVTLSKETILKTREQAIQICIDCVEEVLSGEVYLNPEYGILRYTNEQQCEMFEIELGNHDHYLSFIQKAYYIQSGKSIPILE